MAFTPSSAVRLLNVPLDNTYENQLTFATVVAQETYFNTKIIKNVGNDFTFVKKDTTLRVNENIDRLYKCNYVMYRNENFGNKWFYAFITNMQWQSDASTIIEIETDVYQTWQFNIDIRECYIEREHTDISNVMTIDEGLDYGNEYVCRGQDKLFEESTQPYCFIITMKETVEDIMADKEWQFNVPLPLGTVPSSTFSYYCGTSAQAFDFFNFVANPATPEEVKILNNPPQKPEKPNLAPGWFEKNAEIERFLDFNGSSAVEYLFNDYSYNATLDRVRKRSARISNSILQVYRLPYTPKVTLALDKYNCRRIMLLEDSPISLDTTTLTNNTFSEPKLNYYPYTIFKMTDHKGSQQIIKPEYCSSPQVKRVLGFGTPVKIRYTLNNYQDGINAKDMSIVNSTTTCLPVKNDAYGSYLLGNSTQNDVALSNSLLGIFGNIGMGLAFGGGGAAIGAGITGAISGYQQVASLNAKKTDIKNQPPTVTGGSGNAIFELRDNEDSVYIEKWTVNDTYAKVLTNYFNRYGYSVKQTKVPNITSKPTFNFIKTNGCNIIGAIPDNDLVRIKQMFNDGVTFWHNPEKVGYFTQ